MSNKSSVPKYHKDIPIFKDSMEKAIHDHQVYQSKKSMGKSVFENKNPIRDTNTRQVSKVLNRLYNAYNNLHLVNKDSQAGKQFKNAYKRQLRLVRYMNPKATAYMAKRNLTSLENVGLTKLTKPENRVKPSGFTSGGKFDSTRATMTAVQGVQNIKKKLMGTFNVSGGSKVGSENYTKTQYNRPAGGKGMFTMPAGALKKIADKFIKRN